jgi:hypothetical protein
MAPGRFRLVDYHAEPVGADHEPSEDLLTAAEVCPMEAIRVGPAETDQGRETA